MKSLGMITHLRYHHRKNHHSIYTGARKKRLALWVFVMMFERRVSCSWASWKKVVCHQLKKSFNRHRKKKRETPKNKRLKTLEKTSSCVRRTDFFSWLRFGAWMFLVLSSLDFRRWWSKLERQDFGFFFARACKFNVLVFGVASSEISQKSSFTLTFRNERFSRSDKCHLLLDRQFMAMLQISFLPFVDMSRSISERTKHV